MQVAVPLTNQRPTPSDGASSGQYSAVMFDFGGVLTTSLLAGFQAFGDKYGNRDLPLKILGTKGSASAKLLGAHEEGRISAAEFEQGYHEELAEHGLQVPDRGTIEEIQSYLHPDRETIDLVAEIRQAGVPTGLLSNSFGDNTYAGFDLESMFDAVTISGVIGARKPSRVAYLTACQKLEVAPEQTVMIDDLQHNLDAAARLGMGAIRHTDAASTRAQLSDLLSNYSV